VRAPRLASAATSSGQTCSIPCSVTAKYGWSIDRLGYRWRRLAGVPPHQLHESNLAAHVEVTELVVLGLQRFVPVDAGSHAWIAILSLMPDRRDALWDDIVATGDWIGLTGDGQGINCDAGPALLPPQVNRYLPPEPTHELVAGTVLAVLPLAGTSERQLHHTPWPLVQDGQCAPDTGGASHRPSADLQGYPCSLT